MPHGSIVSSQIGRLSRVGNDSSSVIRDGRVSSSSPLASSGIMHGSPLSDDSSHHSDSAILNDGFSNGVVNHTGPKPLDNALYSQCVLAMCSLAKDPSPRIASLGRRVLSIIGIEQVVAKPLRSAGVRIGEPMASPSLAGLVRSSSWFDMNGGGFSLFPFNFLIVSYVGLFPTKLDNTFLHQFDFCNDSFAISICLPVYYACCCGRSLASNL